MKIRTQDLLLMKHECYFPECDVLLKRVSKNDLNYNTDVGIFYLTYIQRV